MTTHNDTVSTTSLPSTAPTTDRTNDLPQPAIVLDDPAGKVYIFAPGSAHRNSLTVNVTNPLMVDVLNGPNARIVITFATSETSDPNALTSSALAKLVQAKVVAFDTNWTYDHQQEGANHSIVLKPQGKIIVGHGDHSIVSIVLSNIETHLPAGLVPLHVSVRDFPGLGEFATNLVLHRSPYPVPTITLLTESEKPLAWSAPLLASWDVAFADTLTVTFSDGHAPDQSYSLEKGQVSLSEKHFMLSKNAFFSGTITLVASNDSNVNEVQTLKREVVVLPPDHATITSSLDYATEPPTQRCLVEPAALMSNVKWSFNETDSIDGTALVWRMTVGFTQDLPPTTIEYEHWIDNQGSRQVWDTWFPIGDPASEKGSDKVNTYTGGDSTHQWSATFDRSKGPMVQSSVLTLLIPQDHPKKSNEA